LIWNLHADAHDFDSQTSSLEEVSRKIFSAHFGQLAVIFLWISGMHFHGAYFSNYSAWLNDPVNIKQSSQVVWPIVGQEILNGDVGGNFQGIQTTSGWFQMWRAEGITSEVELYWIAIGGLAMSAIMLFAGWFHYQSCSKIRMVPKRRINDESSFSRFTWIRLFILVGHQIHIALPINKLLDAGVAPQEIPLPHEF
jgi:photosystem I P700 chlorophyll a apoprotein A1